VARQSAALDEDAERAPDGAELDETTAAHEELGADAAEQATTLASEAEPAFEDEREPATVLDGEGGGGR
jgi:hypothetical protein